MAELDATITLTPEGVVDPREAGDMRVLAKASTAELQNFDRAIRSFRGSENRLLNASADLMAVFGTFDRLSAGDDIHTMRVELSRAIVDLKYRVVQLDYPPSVAENLCLLFAIVIDEFVLLSDWGAESGWENRTLVADLFGFRDGGDRFYSIAERALMQPKSLQEFLQIIYIFLKLGYRGRYGAGAEHERDRLIDRLDTSIALNTGAPEVGPVGRSPVQSAPPASLVPASRKILAAVVVIALVTGGVILARAQVASTLAGDFARQAEAAAGVGPATFVFSSETGLTTRRIDP